MHSDIVSFRYRFFQTLLNSAIHRKCETSRHSVLTLSRTKGGRPSFRHASHVKYAGQACMSSKTHMHVVYVKSNVDFGSSRMSSSVLLQCWIDPTLMAKMLELLSRGVTICDNDDDSRCYIYIYVITYARITYVYVIIAHELNWTEREKDGETETRCKIRGWIAQGIK